MNTLKNLNAYEYSILGSLIGLLLCDGLKPIEQQSIGNFLEQVGQVMLTVSSQIQVNNQNNQSTIDYDYYFKILEEKIINLREQINEIKSWHN